MDDSDPDSGTLYHSDDDEDLIFGYIVFEPHIMHYVYVKEPFRNYGIGKRLIQEIEQPFQTATSYSLCALLQPPLRPTTTVS